MDLGVRDTGGGSFFQTSRNMFSGATDMCVTLQTTLVSKSDRKKKNAARKRTDCPVSCCQNVTLQCTR